MTIPLARKKDGKKFLWDGSLYESQQQAAQVMEAYEKDGFEVRLFVEGDKYLVYSRRVAVVESTE